jgi:TadE-like protein
MLLVLLLGIADFGRVFAAGITVEASARDGAEAAAIERLRAGTPITPGDADYYKRLHVLAAKAACTEARSLPNTTFVLSDDPATTTVDEAHTCPEWPVIRACVHDDLSAAGGPIGDPLCGQPIDGFAATIPAGCNQMTGWANTSGGSLQGHSVEVRVCYSFTTLLNLHLNLPFGWGLSLGDLSIERTRMFIVDCPPGDVTPC